MRTLIGGLILFVAVFASDFLVHQVLLREAYVATASLWRPEVEMQGMMKFMLLGQLIFALAFYVLFKRGLNPAVCPVKQGAIYGGLLGLMFASGNLMWYSVLPIPSSLAIQWALYGWAQTFLLGVISGLLCLCCKKACDTKAGSCSK